MSELTEEFEEQAAGVIQFLEQVEDVEIPRTIKQAELEGWELTADMLQATRLLRYDPVERKRDAQQLVRLRDVLEILAKVEDNTVRELVINPSDIMANWLFAFIGIFTTLLPRIVTAIIGAWKNRDIITIVWNILRVLWKELFQIISVKSVSDMISNQMVWRDLFVKQVRAKALFQSTGSRCYRRKVTRR